LQGSHNGFSRSPLSDCCYQLSHSEPGKDKVKDESPSEADFTLKQQLNLQKRSPEIITGEHLCLSPLVLEPKFYLPRLKTQFSTQLTPLVFVGMGKFLEEPSIPLPEKSITIKKEREY